MLVGAVARIFRNGVKFDLVLTLVGSKQGTGKSTFFAKLGREWFSDSFHTISGKEAFEQLQGAWIIEMAEMSGVRKSEVEPTKHFITKREDTYRPAYGRIVETYKRKCVFVATTNEKDFLRDPSGGRRFMPVDVHEYRTNKNILSSNELVGDQVDQVWAEALSLYVAKEPLYLSVDAEKIARKEQREHSQVDDRQGLVDEYLEKLLPVEWADKDLHERRIYLSDALSPTGVDARQYVCIAEIWCECLGKDKSDMTRYNTREINDILRSLDEWQHHNTTKNFPLYGKQKYYSRKLY
jgi:predicted P-loop ATPase